MQRNSIINAQYSVYHAVNAAMVQAYWEIGEQIYKACGENDRAEYGKNLLKFLSERLTFEFGKGFDESNSRKMRQFYMAFPIRDTLCPELSWSHYRRLMRIENKKIRNFYTEECAKSGWSVRQLDRQINSFFYERLLSSKDKNYRFWEKRKEYNYESERNTYAYFLTAVTVRYRHYGKRGI